MQFRKYVFMLGQKWRELTHVRRFEKAVRAPRETQAAKLMEIIRANEESAYGRAHRFELIRSIEDYQALVPPADYEDLKPYVDASMAGAKRQLSGEDPFMFATTSGTTAEPKFIPVTRAQLKDYTHAFQIHNYHMIRDYPREALGKFFIIVSNDREGRVACGLPYGAVSGLLNRRQSAFVRRSFALPYEVCKVKDVDAKYYLMLRSAMAQDVTAIMACNPSSLLLLADQLKEHAEDLLRDLHDGTLTKRFSPAPEIADAFAPVLGADREKSRALRRLAEDEGCLLPRMLWPNLGLISCWKGGPMGFYLDQLPEYYGRVDVRDFGYMASEGRGSIPIGNDGAGGVAALTSHFFEFVPEEDADKDDKPFLTLDQLERDRRYYIYFTTAAGLYRYNINDLVEVVGFYRSTPVIQFVRKGAGISSITGEKLTEEQVRVALSHAVTQLKLNEIQHFTASVQLGNPPHYGCFAELARDIPDSVKREFTRVFDRSLRAQNPEYEDKRSTKRLGTPEFFRLPRGTYTKLRQERVHEGAPEAQVKIPLLASRGDIGERLATLAAGVRQAE